MATRATQLKTANGRHVSARSKTGDPACSLAMSTWKTKGMNPAVAKVLAHCRALSAAQRKATLQRAAGQEARAQHIEHRAASGAPLTAKDRTARAREILALRAARRTSAAPTPRQQAEAHRATRPGREDRISLAINKAGGLRRDREARGKMAAADVHAGRQARLRETLDRLKGRDQGGFNLKAKVPGAGFRNEGRGQAGTLFEEMRGAAARDLPGQSNFLGSEKPDHLVKGRPTPLQAAGSHRLAKAIGGDSRRELAEKIRALRAQARTIPTDPASHTEHAPGTVTELKSDLIHFDPDRFQYKMDKTSKTGATGSLAGVEAWDKEVSGVLQVWKDPENGKVYVVNGHNRLDLAKRLGVDRVGVRFIDAADERQARAKGALTNIAEGRGTSLDAAQFFRDSEHTRESLKARGIPLRERVATEGLALAGLEAGLWRKAKNGEIPLERAALIGGSGLEHHHQKALADLIDKQPKGKPITNGVLKELTDTVTLAPSAKKETFDLFGGSEEETSLALHRARLQDSIKERLGQEKRLFGTVAKQKSAEELARAGNQINTEESGRISEEAAQTLQAFDQLKKLTGPVSKALNEGAERLHAGESAQQVHQDIYRRILRELPEFLRGGAQFAM